MYLSHPPDCPPATNKHGMFRPGPLEPFGKGKGGKEGMAPIASKEEKKLPSVTPFAVKTVRLKHDARFQHKTFMLGNLTVFAPKCECGDRRPHLEIRHCVHWHHIIAQPFQLSINRAASLPRIGAPSYIPWKSKERILGQIYPPSHGHTPSPPPPHTQGKATLLHKIIWGVTAAVGRRDYDQ